MSLPLTRRIAQAALLVAAGATPLIGAGAASATELLPKGDLVGSTMTQLDAPDSSSTVQGATHELGETAGTTGAATVATAVPATADATGHTVAAALPDANKTLGGVTAPAAKTTAVAGTLTNVAGKAAPALADKVGPAVTERLVPMAGGHRAAATSPLGGLPTGGLTASSLTQALPTGALTQGLPTGALTGGLPTGSVTKSLPGADALPLDTLTGHADAHRLGGAVPGLGSNPTDAVTGLLGGALPTGALTSHLPLLGG